MANSESERRHNPTRTEIPSTFVDLGKLFDEDSRKEYMSPPKTGRVRNSQEVTGEIDGECVQSEPQDSPAEDFMIG
jgi:hypothetical protein